MISAQKYGPWAVIAGGSEGIGASFAQKLARAGINLVLIARKPGPLEDLARELRAANKAVEVRTLQLDLLRTDVVDRIREITDSLDVGLLIFNAAEGTIKSFLEQTLDEALKALRLSGIAQTAIVHHFAPRLVKRGRGGIIMVGSLGGNAGSPNIATYCGSKAYTQIFGEALWGELSPRGIDVLVTVLGSVDTPNMRRQGPPPEIPGMPLLTSDEVAQHALDNIANGPVQVPPQIAKVFQYVCAAPRRQLAETAIAQAPLPHKT